MGEKLRVVAEDVEIELQEAAVKEQAQAFRERLQPFGLDKFMLSDTPERIVVMPDKRVLAEFKTMWLSVWYPETMKRLKAAGLQVVTKVRRYNKAPPQVMYHVRAVQEILGGNYGNQ